MTTYLYRSPSRPLDLGWAEKASNEDGIPFEINWDLTEIGEWTPETRYAFNHRLSQRFVHQWSLTVQESMPKPLGYDDMPPDSQWERRADPGHNQPGRYRG